MENHLLDLGFVELRNELARFFGLCRVELVFGRKSRVRFLDVLEGLAASFQVRAKYVVEVVDVEVLAHLQSLLDAQFGKLHVHVSLDDSFDVVESLAMSE